MALRSGECAGQFSINLTPCVQPLAHVVLAVNCRAIQHQDNSALAGPLLEVGRERANPLLEARDELVLGTSRHRGIEATHNPSHQSMSTSRNVCTNGTGQRHALLAPGVADGSECGQMVVQSLATVAPLSLHFCSTFMVDGLSLF